MRVQNFAFAALTAFISQSLAAPASLLVSRGLQTKLIVTAENTINGTNPIPGAAPAVSNNPLAQLGFAFINHLPSNNVHAYFTGMDVNGKAVMLQPDGTFYYPNANGAQVPAPVTANIAIPLGGQGSTTTIKLPDYLRSARVWFSDGTLQFYVVAGGGGMTSLVMPSSVNAADPSNGVNWGFIELDNEEATGLYVNVSYVDFVGMALGISLATSDGAPAQSAKGLPHGGFDMVCADLKAQAAIDGAPWDKLCQVNSNGAYLRAIAPPDYISANPSAFSNYWTSYIDQVYAKYTNEVLVIDTQAGPGKVNCQVQGGVFTCAGDEYTYAKPSAMDIFGCNSGPFAAPPGGSSDVHKAVVPRLCAAFNRSEFLVSGGNVEPSVSSSQYYTTSPTNHYSRIVHKYEVDGRGYAFSYDDVNPSGENQSGELSSTAATVLTVTIGGP